jgi:membrane protein implicated in regulation of membrane protease activity
MSLRRSPGPKLTAALTTLVSAVAAVVTNLVTDAWSWGLAAALAVLVLAGAAPAARTKVSQTASGGSTIRGSHLYGHAGALVEEAARNQGEITDSSIRARGADAARVADGGLIHDSHIDAH